MNKLDLIEVLKKEAGITGNEASAAVKLLFLKAIALTEVQLRTPKLR